MKDLMTLTQPLLDAVYLLSDVGNLDSVDIKTPPRPPSPQVANFLILLVLISLAKQGGHWSESTLQAAVPTVHLLTPDPSFLNTLFSPLPRLLLLVQPGQLLQGDPLLPPHQEGEGGAPPWN